MKRIIYIIIILLTICTPFVFADVYDSAITDEVKEGINDSFETLYTETGLDIDALEMIDELNKGNFNFDLSGIMGKFRQTVFTSLDDNIKGFARVLVLILLSSVILLFLEYIRAVSSVVSRAVSSVVSRAVSSVVPNKLSRMP